MRIETAQHALTRRQFVSQISTACLVAACAPDFVATNDRSSIENGPIPLVPHAETAATLLSSEDLTTFSMTGVTDVDLALPPTNIARVLLPPRGITITARAPCYKPQVRFIQAGDLSDGSEISFVFTGLNRLTACNDVSAGNLKSVTQPPPSSGRLAWVIANSDYDGPWPQLPFVNTDRAKVVATLRTAGYDVTVSSNRTKDQLSADIAALRSKIAQQRPSVAIIYMSGHGISLDRQNYFVAIGATATTADYISDFCGIADIYDPLRSVIDAGGLAVVLVDACRVSDGKNLQPLSSERSQRIIINHSAQPGMVSFDSERGMSAWTEQFVNVSNAFPTADIIQILGYANRYTKWQSEASLRVQNPVLYGILPEVSPPLAINGETRQPSGTLPRLN